MLSFGYQPFHVFPGGGGAGCLSFQYAQTHCRGIVHFFVPGIAALRRPPEPPFLIIPSRAICEKIA
jgi:hypothetical protein